MLKSSILAAVLCCSAAAFAQQPLLSFDDPAGDDNGDGTLIYPPRADLQPGDLDLRSLKVFRESDGLRFEATFQNAIRDPATVSNDVGSNESLSVFARRGFYNFNIDVYIDTDRIPGSGNVATLPGRRAQIDPAHAWEKVVVLTPRPEVMRRQLQEALTEAAGKGAGDLGPTLERSVYFATQVRVRGKTVSFFVPDSFLGSSAGAADWSMTVFVTAAKVNIESDMRLFGSNAAPLLQRLALGVLQPVAGRPSDAFGYAGDDAPATSVIDLLAPGGTQQRQLAAGVLQGVDRNTRLAQATAAAANPPAPTRVAPPAPPAGGSIFSRALDSVNRLFGFGGAAAAAAPAAPASSPSLQSLLQPAAPAPASAPAATNASASPAAAPRAAPPVAPAAPAAPAADPRKARDAAFYEEQELRLRTLKRLRDGGLISEQEYQQKRKEVLEQL